MAAAYRNVLSSWRPPQPPPASLLQSSLHRVHFLDNQTRVHHAQVTTNGVPTLALVMVEAVGGRRYGCRAVLLYSQRRLLMWKQTDKTPLREVTINYFKWP
jgi:hypothetical protein